MNIIDFRPVADNVVVLMDWLRDRREERMSAGGILLPMADKPAHDAAVMATVISAGPGAFDERIAHDEGMPTYKKPKASTKFVPMDPGICRGARVVVDQAIAGDPLIVDGIEYRVVRAGNIIGIAVPEAAE